MKQPSGASPILIIAGLLLCSAVAAGAARAESACIRCHGSLQGTYGRPVVLWGTSIHAKNGVSCHECHGGDPADPVNAMNPARGFRGVPKETAIPEICGRCHVGVLRDYLASAHGKRLGSGGPTCVTCHGNHAVQRASLDLINEQSCSRCHPYERARLMKQAMQETESRITSLQARIQVYQRGGADTEPLEKGLFSIRNRFHTLFHSVEIERVRNETGAIGNDLAVISRQLDAIDLAARKRKLAGAVVVAGALLAALLFHLLGRTYDRT